MLVPMVAAAAAASLSAANIANYLDLLYFDMLPCTNAWNRNKGSGAPFIPVIL